LQRGKPAACKERLISAEREVLHRRLREVRQLQTERDILARAAACFGLFSR